MPSVSWECIAFDGVRVPHGGNFVPGPDNCTACKCEKGEARFCRAALCQPPQDCRSFRVSKTCCEFICLDDILPTLHNDVNILPSNDTGLRMVASSIVAILSLALLLFLIHRLRKRKLRGCVTQQHFLEGQEDYIPTSSSSSHQNNLWGRSTALYLSGNDHVDLFLNGCPPPYPPWKPPPYYLQSGSDAPPPYSEVMANDISTREATRLPSLSPLMVELISRQPVQESGGSSLPIQNRQIAGSLERRGKVNDDGTTSVPSRTIVRTCVSLPFNQVFENRSSLLETAVDVDPNVTGQSSYQESPPNSPVVSSASSDTGNHSASSRDVSQSDSVSSSNNSATTSTQSSSHRSSEDHSLTISSPEPGGENDFSVENSTQTTSDRTSSRSSQSTYASCQDVSSEHIINESSC